MTRDDISNVQAEAGVVNTLVHHPEFCYNSENLTADHFTDKQNGAIYAAISALVHDSVMQIDAFNIISKIDNDSSLIKYRGLLKIDQVKEFIEYSDSLVRKDLSGYMLCVNAVLNAALRRDVFQRLKECESLCLRDGQNDIEQKIYNIMDEVLMGYSSQNAVPQYKDVVDKLWGEIKDRQGNNHACIPFKFPTLNEYVQIEPSELIVFAADAKQGKSMMLLNCAVDLLKRGKRVLYIDSELNSRLFTCRLLAHIAKVQFKRVRDGDYSTDEEKRIQNAIKWMKTRAFTHIYMPIFNVQSMYTIIKKVFHTQGIDVLIVDYLKSSGDGDAFATYQELGKLTDMIKNTVCGELNIAGIAAAQATSTGKVADSAKLGRNASTIILIQQKTLREIETDGIECGNKKMRVVLNRNGMQMTENEYIDLQFDGNLISYEEATQHTVQEPY